MKRCPNCNGVLKRSVIVENGVCYEVLKCGSRKDCKFVNKRKLEK